MTFNFQDANGEEVGAVVYESEIEVGTPEHGFVRVNICKGGLIA